MSTSSDNSLVSLKLFSISESLKNFSKLVTSPSLNYVCVISNQREASLYKLPCTDDVKPIWHCSSKVQSCFFSEDGKQLLIILSVNSFQVYSIGEDEVRLSTQVKASVLASLLLHYKIDFSAANKVTPLKLYNTELIVIIDGKLLVSFKWKYNDPIYIKFAVVLPSCKDYSMNDELIFILTNDSVVYAYSILTGHQSSQELNPKLSQSSFSPLPSPILSPSITPVKFISVCSSISCKKLVLVTESHNVTLIDINKYFDMASTKLVNSQQAEKKEKWIWPSKSKKSSVAEEKPLQFEIIKNIAPPEGLVVSCVSSTILGFAITYSILGDRNCSYLQFIDYATGDQLCSYSGLVNTAVVSSTTPLLCIRDDKSFSLVLGSLATEEFSVKLCEIFPNFEITSELKKHLIKNNDLEDYHVKFVKIVLTLHLQMFKDQICCYKTGKKKSKSLIDMSNFLLNVFFDLSKDAVNLENPEVDVDRTCLCDIQILVFLHCVHLLDQIHLEISDFDNVRLVTKFQDISNGFLKHIKRLYPVVKNSDPLSHEFMTWREMTDSEIIQEAVVVGAVALAYVFLVTDRNWSIEDIHINFRTEAEKWVLELISTGDLERAKLALKNMGFNPLDHLKGICLSTNEPLMRDLLASHLVDNDCLAEKEIAAWQFVKKIEGAFSSAAVNYSSYDLIMKVSSQERISCVMFRLLPFHGSVELNSVLKYSSEWWEMVLVECYFCTADIILEKSLNPILAWKYLLESNQIELLTAWVNIQHDPHFKESSSKNVDFIKKIFYNVFSTWTITEDMYNLISESDTAQFTKDSVLNELAKFGIFPILSSQPLQTVVERIGSLSCLSDFKNILSQPTSTVSVDGFEHMILEKCIEHDLKLIAINLLRNTNIVNLCNNYVLKGNPSVLWLDVWKIFKKWQKSKNDKDIMQLAAKMSFILYPHEDKPLMELIIALIGNKELSEILNDDPVISEHLLNIPLIEIGWEMFRGSNNRTPDVTLYDLLCNSAVSADKLFLWQSQNTHGKISEDTFCELPHFNHQVLSAKYGYNQCLDYIYYLKQARPSFACNLFIVETLRTRRRLTSKMIKRACGLAHGLALRYWKDNGIGSACVSFMVMLGDISGANILRIHLAVVCAIMSYLGEDQKYFVGTLLHGIILKDPDTLLEISTLLEEYIVKSWMEKEKKNSVTLLKKWSLAVTFANIHKLPLPTSLPKYFAVNGLWLPFILCLDMYKYPYEQVILLVEEISSKVLKSHLIRAFTRTTLKLSTTSPSKSPPKILLEPDSYNTTDDQESSKKDNKDAFKTFVTNIYTEVLNTIQTFTDRNIVLPWSCEQNPDEDVLLTFLKAESEPDTSKILLLAAHELQSPVLSILATCFQSEEIISNFHAWYVSSIPTSLSRLKRREEGQLFIEQLSHQSDIGDLIIQFFGVGYYQTLFRGLTYFLNENPITLVMEAIYQCISLLDFAAGQESFKELTATLEPHKDTMPASKLWILKITCELVECVLTRSDITHSVKKDFLSALVYSGLAGFNQCFPNYQLWYRICEILETTGIVLNFNHLCKESAETEEVQRCLSELTQGLYFEEALALCEVLNLNKDPIIIAQWTEKFRCGEKTNSINAKWWSDSSETFCSDIIEASVAAEFYHKCSTRFSEDDSESLKNRYYSLQYCLLWRKKFEDDTSSINFKEESDSVELEKWKCTINPRFDLSVIGDEYKTKKPCQRPLTVNIWFSSQVFAKSQLLTHAETNALESVCNLLLDAGDFHTALRLTSFFNHNHQDLNTIKNCYKLALGLTTYTEVSKYNSLLLRPRIRKLDTSFHGASSTDPMLADFENVEVPTKEQQEIICLLDKLTDSVNHGYNIANKILVCYRISVNLDTDIRTLAEQADYLEILTNTMQGTMLNKFSIASDLLILADLSDIQLAKFLKENILTAIEHSYVSGLVEPVTLWDVSFETEFHLVMQLCKNPSVFGFELLNASISASPRQGVELLIRAHDCFTSVCNVEGIGAVLRRARILASQLLQAQQWRFLVMMLTGIGRYSDMSYIFQMLKDNHQFEFLLKKGMDKVRGLQLAICDFLQRHCAEDHELRKMVTSHFHLYSQEAGLWLSEAETIVDKLLSSESQLKDNVKTRQALQLAMENYAHAAECCVRSGKVKRALTTSYQAQLIALQISLLGVHTILGLSSSVLQTLIAQQLSVSQILLLTRAYDVEPDWANVLHERWVVKGDKTLFNDLKTSNIITPLVVRSYRQRFEAEDSSKAKARDRIKQLLVPQQQTSCYFKDINRNK